MQIMNVDKHVFSEQETSAILQKAAKLQEESSDVSYTPGVTKEELERIAVEAGIDPKYVLAALKDLSVDQPKRHWLNLSEAYERVIEGEVDPDDFDQIFAGIKPSNMRNGGFKQVGRTVTLQTYYRGAMCHVELTSRQGRTRIQVKSVPFVAYLMSLHPAVILGAVAGANMGAAGNPLLGFLTLSGLMLAGVAGFAGLVKKGHNSARLLVDELEKRVQEQTDAVRKSLVKSRPVPVEPPLVSEQLNDLPG